MEVTLNRLQVEKMASRLLIDCIANRRIQSGMSDIMNCHSGGDSNQWEFGKKSKTISVAIDLVLLEYDKEEKDELWPHLLEYFFSEKIDVFSNRKAEDLADEVLRGWANILKDYAKVS